MDLICGVLLDGLCGYSNLYKCVILVGYIFP